MNRNTDDSAAGALGILAFIIGWLVIISLHEIIAVFVAAVITGLKIMAVMIIGYLILMFIGGALSGLLGVSSGGVGVSRNRTTMHRPIIHSFNGTIQGDESLRFTEEEARAIKGREGRLR